MFYSNRKLIYVGLAYHQNLVALFSFPSPLLSSSFLSLLFLYPPFHSLPLLSFCPISPALLFTHILIPYTFSSPTPQDPLVDTLSIICSLLKPLLSAHSFQIAGRGNCSPLLWSLDINWSQSPEMNLFLLPTSAPTCSLSPFSYSLNGINMGHCSGSLTVISLSHVYLVLVHATQMYTNVLWICSSCLLLQNTVTESFLLNTAATMETN